MAVTSHEFFQLLGKSRLLRPDQLERLQSRVPNSAAAEDAKPIARRLVMERILTRYQASVILGGRAGPFLYGDYQVFDRINGGRLSGMFKAVHTPSGHPVVLKFATGSLAQDARQWDLADRYIRLQTKARHAQLQQVYQLADITKFRFLVLENLSGQSLQDAMKKGKLPVAVGEACRLTRLAAMALTYLHQQGHAYGDIRPRNLWLEPNANLRLLRDNLLPPAVPDLFATDLSDEELERWDYLAPELANPGTPVSHLTDIYALGCSLYEMLSGKPPFAGQTASEKLEQHATQPIATFKSADVPPELARIVAFMMAKKVTVRTQQTQEIVVQLEPFIAPDELSVPPTTPPATQIAYDLAIRQQEPIATSPPPASVPAAPPPPSPPAEPHVNTPADPAPHVAEAPRQSTAQPLNSLQTIHTEESSQTSDRVRRLRQAQRNRTRMLAAFAATLIVVALGVLAFSTQARQALFGSGSNQQVVQSNDRIVPDEPPVPDSSPDEPPPLEASGPFHVLPDDGQLLWASPTSGAPIQLNFVPPGVQFLLVVRPSALLQSPEGARVLQALGPDFQAAQEQWQTEVGVLWNQIDQLVFTLHDNGQDFPRAAFVIHLLEPQDEQALADRWAEAERIDVGATHYFLSAGRAYYVPEDGQGKVLVVAAAADIKEVIEFAGAEPAMRREMATLVQASDRDRHLVIVFAPSFLVNNLFRDGRNYVFGDGRRVRKPLEWLFEDNLKACLLSCQFGDPFYVELRAYGQVDHDSAALAGALRQRMQDLPERIEAYFLDYYPPAYWRRVALRVPEMVRFLHRQIRTGVEDDQAIVNAAMPATAAHNLAFAGQMLLVSPQADPGTTTAAVESPFVPQTMDALLDAAMNLSFDQKSLEFAMRDLAADVKELYPSLPFEFEVKILGTDLQLNGITRNQQIASFSADNQSVAEILTSLVMRANPVTTVQAPTELDQKLIWVVGPDPDMPNRQIVLITTRDAATKKSYPLPKCFQPEPN